MDLRSHAPFWLLKHGILNSYPSLPTSTRADVAIIGAGITGALMADHVCKAGFDVLMLDRRHAGHGSTAASTALLQYEIDTPLHKLISLVGQQHAVRSYTLCLEAIHRIGTIAGRFKDVEFVRKPSFQFASFQKHVENLRKEYTLRRQHGISTVHWLEERDVRDKYTFAAPAGLLSRDGAELDCYHLTHALLSSNQRRGLRVYDNTEVVQIRHHKRSVELLTAGGHTVTARKLIICCGYESQRYLPKVIESQHSTYAIISEPFEEKNFWHRNSLIWETATPYLYMRTTSDKRILIGGKDDDFYQPDKRDSRIPQKRQQLEHAFRKLFPDIPFKTDFSWAGTFCGTKDGLPYIGSIRQRPHTYFALGFGGNGITFSVIAAAIVRDLLLGKSNPDSALFTFDR
ncbi:FAD-binding oxidoreductase [Fulvivirgaceae bacterium PWU5]|uniref:FAD-binding oxidoreductase n=1 Tax=Dawidia cretensis TaxID=2782350 RepID=A0AAP2GV45_9BACT|nr:FAD-dependent oxidoreductase [Dawidia cretensis]MBT1709845.1 FAD-binding oxidoreductase [Dawidia cretensis]